MKKQTSSSADANKCITSESNDSLKVIAAKRLKWRKGDLRFMLRPSQTAAYDFFKASPTGTETILCMHRGAGKTHLEAVCAAEFAQTHPNATVHFIGQTRQDTLEYVLSIFEKIFDAAHLEGEDRPRWSAEGNCYKFRNNARILVYGGDIRIDTKRGRDVNAAFVDEIGFFRSASIVDEVLMPRVLLYGGKMMLASTPPKSIAHPYALRIKEAESRGSLFRFTVRDNPLITEEQIELFARKSGGEDSATFRREYLCEVLTDDKYAVFPEFTKKSSTSLGVATWGTPTTMGLHCDFTGVTSGVLTYHDKASNKLVVVDDFSIHKASIEDVKIHVSRIVEKYANPSETLIYCKGTDRVVQELSTLPCPVIQAKKLDLSEAIAILRSIILMGRLEIATVSSLPFELDGVIWNETRKDFDVSGNGGRFDVVKALCVIAGEFSSLLANDADSNREHFANMRVFAGLSDDSMRIDVRTDGLLKGLFDRNVF